MPFHPFARCVMQFQKEKSLREILLEIEDIRKDQAATIKQNIDANTFKLSLLLCFSVCFSRSYSFLFCCSSILKWAEKEPSHVHKLLQDILAIESEIHISESELTAAYLDFKAYWRNVLTARCELTAPEAQLHQAQKDLLHAEKMLTSSTNPEQLEHFKKRKAELTEDIKRKEGEVRKLSLTVEQEIETHLRQAYYKLGAARMKHYEVSSALQEKWFPILLAFKQTKEYATNETNVASTFADFADKLEPAVDTTWCHGKDAATQLPKKEDAPRTNVDGCNKRDYFESALSEAWLLLNDSKKYVETDSLEFITSRLEQCFQCIDALSSPAVVLDLTSASFLEKFGLITSATAVAIFSADDMCSSLIRPEQDHSRVLLEAADAGDSLCAELNSALEKQDNTTILSKTNVLKNKLQAILKLVSTLPHGFSNIEEQSREIAQTKQEIAAGLKTLQELSAQAASAPAEQVAAIQSLISSGMDVLNVADQILDQASNVQGFTTSAESFVSKKNWARSMKLVIDAFLQNFPVWTEAVKKVVTNKASFDELQALTTNLSGAAAQLSYFAQVIPYDQIAPQKTAIFSNMEKFIKTTHAMNQKAIDLQCLVATPVVQADLTNLSEQQAKKALLETQANVLRFECQLKREQEKLAQLRKLNYETLKQT